MITEIIFTHITFQNKILQRIKFYVSNSKYHST